MAASRKGSTIQPHPSADSKAPGGDGQTREPSTLYKVSSNKAVVVRGDQPIHLHAHPNDTSQPTNHLLTTYSRPQLVVTPVAFISFLVSLVIVDLHYSHVRVRSHAQAPSRLPPWLHALLFRPRPYESLRVRRLDLSSSQQQQQQQGRTEWHYHSNQRKLMEMEAAEAFEIRNTVLVVLALAAAGGTGATWYAASRLYHHWYP